MLTERAEAMHRVCFDSEPREADLALLGSRDGWLVYRDLVRTRLVEVIEAAFPRTKGAVGTSSFRQVVEEWLATGGPRTGYFSHVPSELAQLGVPVWQRTATPWIAYLGRYEAARWVVRHAPPDPEPVADFAFDTRPVVATGLAILRLGHRVHETPTPANGYANEPVVLCIHRDSRHRAAAQSLNPLAAHLLEAWQRGEETVAHSVHRVAAEHGTEIGPIFVDKLSTLITNFLEQGILRGGRIG